MALDHHTDVLEHDAARNAFRMIVSCSACQCTADEVARLGVTPTHVSAFRGIKNPRADWETTRLNGEFTRGFRASASQEHSGDPPRRSTSSTVARSAAWSHRGDVRSHFQLFPLCLKRTRQDYEYGFFGGGSHLAVVLKPFHLHLARGPAALDCLWGAVTRLVLEVAPLIRKKTTDLHWRRWSQFYYAEAAVMLDYNDCVVAAGCFYGCFLVIEARGGTWFRTPCPSRAVVSTVVFG